MFERLRCVAAAGISVLIFALPSSAGAAESTAATAAAPADTSVYQQDEVVVTASRYGTDVHLSQTNLTTAEIRRNQSAQDIPMALDDIPGVYSYSDAGNGLGYTYLKIRGFDQKRIGVVVNGIPLNDPEDHQVYWVDLPDLASSLEDIQVQRGITNGIGGVTAIGGSVNLVTNVLGEHPQGRATLEAGSFGTQRRMLSYRTGDLGGGFSTGLRLSQVESDGYRERAGTDQWAVFWSGQWQNEVHRIQANFYTGEERTHHAWDPAPESILQENRRYNPERYWNAIDDFRQPHYELHWEWDLARDLLLRNSVYAIHGEGYYENYKEDEDAALFSLDHYFPFDGAGGYTDSTTTDLIRTKWVRKDQVGWVPSLLWEQPGGRLVVGGDWYTFHSNHWGDVLFAGPDEAGQTTSPFDIPGGLKYHDYTGDKDAWSLYLNERLEVLPGLTILADLQYQHREYDFMQNEVGNFRGEDRNAYSVDYDFFNPKGGFFWNTPLSVAGGSVGLYGHVGITHREPADTDYWGAWIGGDDLGAEPVFAEREEIVENGEVQYVRWSDPLIEPERVVNWEGGVAFKTRSLSLTVNGYYMDFENEIVETGYSADDNAALRYNADETVHQGLELGLRWNLARDHRLRVAGSRSWNEYESFVFVEYPGAPPLDVSGNPIPLFPETIASVIWTSDLGPLSADLKWRHVGKQYLDNTGDEERTIDASNVVDVAVFADLGRLLGAPFAGAQAYLRVFNLLDEEYETWGYYDPWTYGENLYIPGAERSYLVGVNYDF